MVEMALETEEDILFADISKQISLLIMDDDEDPTIHYQPADSLQVFSQPISPFPSGLDQSYKRESKGTGVFIPRSSWPRRKNKTRRYPSLNNNSYRQMHNRSTKASNMTNNSNQSGNYCNCQISRKHE